MQGRNLLRFKFRKVVPGDLATDSPVNSCIAQEVKLENPSLTLPLFIESTTEEYLSTRDREMKGELQVESEYGRNTVLKHIKNR